VRTCAFGLAEHLVDLDILCVMPRQPTANDRVNGCWIPPVVACANYYRPAGASAPPCSVDSILA